MALPQWARPADHGDRVAERNKGFGKGLAYNMTTSAFQLLGSVISIIILSRLISPEDFGIYGLALPFVTTAMIIADGGASYFTLRHPRLDEAELSFAFWLGLVRHIVAYGLLLALSPLIALVMEEPELVDAIALLALALPVNGFLIQHMALIQRCFRNDLRAIMISAGVLVSIPIAVAVAAAGHGYRALIFMLIIRMAGWATLGWILTGWRPSRPRWDPALRRRILGLGGPEITARLLLETIRNSDKLLMGIVYTTRTTGAYALAHSLCLMPLLQLISPIQSLLVPYLVELRRDQKQLIVGFATIYAGITGLVWPVAVTVCLYTDTFIPLLLGDQNQGAGDFFALLLLAGTLSISADMVNAPFLATDRPGTVARHNLHLLIIIIGLIAVASTTARPVDIALAVLIANAASLIYRKIALIRAFDLPRRMSVTISAGVLLPAILIPAGIVMIDHIAAASGIVVPAPATAALTLAAAAIAAIGLLYLRHGARLKALLGS